jgi:hypothetical protein
MKSLKIVLLSLIALLMFSSIGLAGDYEWMRDFNIKAKADPSGLKVRLETRFQVGDLKIKAVLGSVDKPADAYMVLRLGEMSNQPVDNVIKKYKTKKGKGWGNLAKSLGIKPGSRDFHSLKQGQDLYDGSNKGNKRIKSKVKGKGKGKK